VTCTATPTTLWPPNHKLRDVTTTVIVADGESGPAGFRMVSVAANEPGSGTGTDDVPVDVQDWQTDTADVAGRLRAERANDGTGRVYTLTYEGRDVAGNTTSCGATVVVPHDAAPEATTGAARPRPVR
jgi:hypothetical protein